ncbi:stage II sporulation protein R [Virgibacillus dakarensis]|nr:MULTISPECIES: stage II sporulation protein R [Bacillaceae]MBT2215318.1 stage II sporulation protein R [Virgibacillus dakarensis]MTW87287.1 stage II sporulation protein R [Virgibacillus dakarensis]
MKKLVFFAFIVILIFIMLPTKGIFQQASSDQGYQVIPDEAIRLRILANSDGDEDQRIKRAVRDEVNKSIAGWVEDIADINKAREVIQGKLPAIEKIVGKVLEKEGVSQAYQVEYGENVTFPTKLYGTYLYPAGEYEAVLITLGEGEGANWWCVLFPPLCFLDFSNGATVAEAASVEEEVKEKEEEEKEEEVEVKFFLFEWLGLS